jgi:hypothetical protein
LGESFGAPISERHNYGERVHFSEVSDYAQEEERLKKLYDQARAQGNKKKKKEYKEKLAELNRLHKYDSAEKQENES